MVFSHPLLSSSASYVIIDSLVFLSFQPQTSVLSSIEEICDSLISIDFSILLISAPFSHLALFINSFCEQTEGKLNFVDRQCGSKCEQNSLPFLQNRSSHFLSIPISIATRKNFILTAKSQILLLYQSVLF